MPATTERTIETLAAEFAAKFETAIRDDKSKYTRVKDGQDSEILTELIHAGHGDMLPDDWRYQCVLDALEAISEDGEDATLEPAIYTSELTDWLASSLDRVGYCDEAIEEYGQPKDTAQLLTWGMAQEQQEVLSSVLSSLQAILEEEQDA